MDREIITAVDDHDINMLERVLKNGADPNIKYDIPIPLVNDGYYDEYYDTNGITPLLYTLHYNNFIDNVRSYEGEDVDDFYNFIKVLLENGADPDIQEDEKKQTPLMVAVEQDRPNIVLLLLENEAEPNITDYEGNTALIYALELYIEKYINHYLYNDLKPNTLSIEYLLSAGANIDYEKINTIIMKIKYVRIKDTIKLEIDNVLQIYDRYNQFKKLSVMSSLNSRLGEQSPLNYLNHDVLSRVANIRYDPMIQRKKYLRELNEMRATANFLKDISQYGSGKHSGKRSGKHSGKRSSKHKKHKRKTFRRLHR